MKCHLLPSRSTIWKTAAIVGVAALSYPLNALADEFTLTASKDSFLRRGASDTNEGANKKLSIQKSGKRRALVAFDLAGVSIPTGEEVVSANLNLNVAKNSKQWGSSGRPIGAHRLLTDWTEGNGVNTKVPRGSKEEDDVRGSRNRGNGSGVTWSCATDTNIANLKANCASKWRGGNFIETATDTVNITKQTTGQIQLDVTNDVSAFLASAFPNYGWLIAKVSSNRPGAVWISSREAAANQPQLVIQTGYAFALTGSSEVPPVSTTASGSCTAVLSNDDTSLAVNCTHTAQNPTMAHVHQGAVGVDGGIVCDLGAGISPITATCAMTPTLVTALRDGLLYVNVHTAAEPDGELRGQIVN